MLTIYHKSLYLDILNATMILRSVGRSFLADNRRQKLREYKQLVFAELEPLCSRMQQGLLQTNDIRESIERIRFQVDISFGQAQKAINVLVKYHYFLFHSNSPVGSQLDCPLDKIILDGLGERVSLSNLGHDQYEQIQIRISQLSDRRVDYDRRWDEQHLNDEGLLPA